ncbi:hypothetical protein SYNPS1DRAFT_28954 [Syncephalis pseudoplumigaleata]|uniref:Uncharacterized protein n=1 Tax=Syncephalis pseudoplumigaleata TaxID=1712513 RepID=A0A4P9Z0C2_9FUNG|nr:hypothetical protein SYNPS1DRAFT_28954 [Syncephalis pseudoplumigaleata]|eukprot:RKP25312.1 hypothetical protein SYNPS1DRAFT_28954 [Syncephalis pseudoplumigaleata]
MAYRYHLYELFWKVRPESPSPSLLCSCHAVSMYGNVLACPHSLCGSLVAGQTIISYPTTKQQRRRPMYALRAAYFFVSRKGQAMAQYRQGPQCNLAEWFLLTTYASCAAYGVAALAGLFLLVYRWRNVWATESHQSNTRLIRRPVDWMIAHFTWCSLVRSAHALILALDVVQSATVRQLLLSLTVCGYLWALAVFLAGVVEAVFLVLRQTSFKAHTYWYRYTERSRTSGHYQAKSIGDVPLHLLLERGILAVIAVVFVVVPCLATTLAYMAGRAVDAGDWSQYRTMDQFSWITWTVGILCLSLLASFYLGSLTSVLQQSAYRLRLSAASFDAAVSCQLIWLIKLMILFYISCSLATILHLCLFPLIMELPSVSITCHALLNVLWWPCLTLAIFVSVGHNGAQKTPDTGNSRNHCASSMAQKSFSTARPTPRIKWLAQDSATLPSSAEGAARMSSPFLGAHELQLTYVWSPLFAGSTLITPAMPAPVRNSSLPHEPHPASPISVTVIVEESPTRNKANAASPAAAQL